MAELEKEVGKSLVVVETTRRDSVADYRPTSTIVTQLFAAKLDLPQTRARRRASAEDAATAYGATGTVLRIARRGHGPSWAA